MPDVYFCLSCYKFFRPCKCCVPSGKCFDDGEFLDDRYLEVFIGTRWDEVPPFRRPLRVIKSGARKVIEKYRPGWILTFEPVCPMCIESMQAGENEC